MEIKFKGIWTPKYVSETLLFPTPYTIQHAETILQSWAEDLVEINSETLMESNEKHKILLEAAKSACTNLQDKNKDLEERYNLLLKEVEKKDKLIESLKNLVGRIM